MEESKSICSTKVRKEIRRLVEYRVDMIENIYLMIDSTPRCLNDNTKVQTSQAHYLSLYKIRSSELMYILAT